MRALFNRDETAILELQIQNSNKKEHILIA